MSDKSNRKGSQPIHTLVEEVVATACAEWSVLRDLEYSAHRPVQPHNLPFNYKQRFDKAIVAIDLVMDSAMRSGIALQDLLAHVSLTSDVFVDDLEKHFASR